VIGTPRLRDGLRDAVVVFLVVRLVLFALSAIGVGLLPLPDGQPTSVPGWPAHIPVPGWQALFTATERQDALWFLRIATEGYRADDGSAAFFPLYPLAVRVVGWIPGIDPLAAALLVSNAALFAALVLLHGLTRLELGIEHARRSLFLVAFFPAAVFLLAPYTESLFLLLSLAAFWFARRDRWAWAAVAGAGAALTRSVGLILILALWIEAIRQWRGEGRAPLPRLAAAAGVALGPALYFAWWWAAHGDLWAPLNAQRNWRPAGTHAPWSTLWQAIDHAWRYQRWWALDLVVVLIAIGGVILVARRIPITYTAYAAGSLLLPLLLPFDGRPLLSVPRFMAVVFPIAWGWSLAAGRDRPPEGAVIGTFASLHGVMALLFISWWYVF
jgi:hypothetical protein